MRTSATGIGALTRALTVAGERFGYQVRTRVTEHPKVYWRNAAVDGTPLRIKIHKYGLHSGPIRGLFGAHPERTRGGVERGRMDGLHQRPVYGFVGGCEAMTDAQR